jgi:outer membrane lipoprotein carrier protein
VFLRLVGILVLLANAGFAARAAAASATPKRTDDPAAAARALEMRLAAVRGLTARFTQEVDSAALPAPQVESGLFYMLRPGRMRWEYQSPPGKLAVADGTSTWLYLPEDRQVLAAPMPRAGRDSGIGLLLGDRPDLLGAFTPRWGPPVVPGGPRTLALRPRLADAAFEEVRVETDGGGFPVVLVVVDPLGGRVTYRFEQIRFTDTIDPALFRFTPPPGIEVIRTAP